MRRSATALACAALLACIACGGSDKTAMNAEQRSEPGAGDTNAAGADANQQQAKQVSYEGCLQKGAGMIGTDYLLTMANEPSGTAGTTGSITSTGSAVEREQMLMAAQMYRLDAKGDVKLGDMVGKRVRVTGVLSEEPHVPNGVGAIGSSLDTQLPNRNRADQEKSGPQINTADLGKLDISSATIVSDSCGARNPDASGRTNGAIAGTDRSPRVVR